MSWSGFAVTLDQHTSQQEPLCPSGMFSNSIQKWWSGPFSLACTWYLSFNPLSV